MWRSLFFSVGILVCSVPAVVAQQNPVPDSSFEEWSNGAPSGWSANGPLIFPSRNAFTGHYAAEGLVAAPSDSAPYLFAMFPVSCRPNKLVGNFELHVSGGDELMVFACTFSHGTPVSQAIFVDSLTTTSYHSFDVPFQLSNDDPPDSAKILIELENANGTLHAGSSFVIDDISFAGSEYDPFVSVKSGLTLTESFTAYPNPTTNTTILRLTTPESGYGTIRIVNTLGAEVARIYSGELSAGEHSFEWDANRFVPGMYECVVRMNGSERSLPIVLKN